MKKKFLNTVLKKYQFSICALLYFIRSISCSKVLLSPNIVYDFQYKLSQIFDKQGGFKKANASSDRFSNSHSFQMDITTALYQGQLIGDVRILGRDRSESVPFSTLNSEKIKQIKRVDTNQNHKTKGNRSPHKRLPLPSFCLERQEKTQT